MIFPSPDELRAALPVSEEMANAIREFRCQIVAILDRRSPRWLVITGPCSIHDPAAAYEYALRLKNLSTRVGKNVLLVMRVYFEKPRTDIGWKGFINDPDLDGRCDIRKGLVLAREILIKISKLGVPIACEFLDSQIPHYISDLISWAAIGARTVESQPHRELASFLPIPIGFKNSTNGSIKAAVDAIRCSRVSHAFLSIGDDGKITKRESKGNLNTHIVLRGGHFGPNFDDDTVLYAQAMLIRSNVFSSIMIDCAHGNSLKQHDRQAQVFVHVVETYAHLDSVVRGVMLESNLFAGSQAISDARYGVSITDPCIGWDQTEQLLSLLSTKVAAFAADY